tara:strand:+ start:328 stop:639 length:312 start_codon:yes stop_codon:yes gene_type:complete
MWTQEEWGKESNYRKFHRWYYNSKLFRYCVYPLFLKFYYRFLDKLNYFFNKKEHDAGLKDIMNECEKDAKDQYDREMLLAWKENNPEEFKKWEESGKPDMFIY